MTSNDSTRDDRQHDDAAAPEGAPASFPAAGSSGASTDSPRYRAAAPEDPQAAGDARDARGAQHRAGSYPATHDPATEPFRTEGLHSGPYAGSEPYAAEGGYPDHPAAGSSARTMPGPRYPAQEHEAARYPSGDAPAWGAPAAEWNRYRGRGTTTWTTRKTVATAAIALAVTGGATAAAYGLSSAAGSSSDSQGGPGGGMGGAGGGMPGGTGTDGETGTDGSGSSGSAGGTQAAPGGSAQGGTSQGGSAQGGTTQGGSSQSGQSGAAGGMGASGLGMAGAAALHSESVVEQDGDYVTMVSQTGTIQKLEDGSLTVKSSDGYSVTYTVSSTSLTGSFSQGDEVTVTGTKNDDAVALKSLAQASSGTDAASGTGSMPGIPGQSGVGGTSSSGGSSGSSGSSEGDSTDS